VVRHDGYVCLLIDTLQLGEIPGVHTAPTADPNLHLKSYGIKDKDKVEMRWCSTRRATRLRASNAGWYSRYRLLVSRRTSMQSGSRDGHFRRGRPTFWIAAADERVKCAVPVSGMSDLESYVKNKVINGQCDCMFLYNTYQWDWDDHCRSGGRPAVAVRQLRQRPHLSMDGNRRIMPVAHALPDVRQGRSGG